MCVHKGVVLNLCDLYPDTAKNLKVRALERREYHFYAIDKA